MKHGVVHGSKTYTARHKARWRAEKLITLMRDLKIHERWELKQRTYRSAEGWRWSVEYTGGQHGES